MALTLSFIHILKYNMNTEGVLTMDIEERTINIGHYIIDKKATVRAAAKYFGVSKSTVHTEGVTLILFICKWLNHVPFGNLQPFGNI